MSGNVPRPSPGLPRASHLAIRNLSKLLRRAPMPQSAAALLHPHESQRLYRPITEKKAKESAERDPAILKKARHRAPNMHGQTSQVVGPQAQLHPGCRVRPISQTRILSTSLRRAPRARVSPTCSHLCDLQKRGRNKILLSLSF